MNTINLIAFLCLISAFGKCRSVDPYYVPFNKFNITLDIDTRDSVDKYTVENDVMSTYDPTTSYVKIYFDKFWITVLTKWCSMFIDTVSVYATFYDNLNIQFYSKDNYLTQSEDKICTITVNIHCKHLTKPVTKHKEGYRYSLSSDSCVNSVELDIDLIQHNDTGYYVLKSYELMVP
ncbi:hypothetical protein RCNV-85A-004 [Raccoonpox virus]|uniref:Poxvirus TNF receptor-II C-terminal domain-containing protein n=1 Tax=Raccoon poxvirus TaxID=10256 RepID=A0A0G3FXH3_RACVI|nr:hypothetical protein ACG19_gp016 [Raccoonpox virus]AKJ93650.1 hypothetical protein RCNV-Herman-016 [Raccoonpox virus]AOP31281.1 hypothetical protein RCNV-85A-004 [Raccoonpox virus]